ncbi:MAG: MFS transporter [Rhodospirillales bacterium]|nr:MFS transporter [Rhodospirillales bacterium]MDH3911388.1 MFS transporter [Rhodospirillales bacterium]MDH3967254.1 MFS transporter [Rhodospirillales bacterium]
MGAETAAVNLSRRRATLGTGGAAHFVHDGLSDSLYVLLPLWAQGFGISHAQVGLLKMAFSGGLSAFQLPAGFLAERWGERIVLALGTAVAGLGFVLLGFAGGFAGLLLCLLLTGLGSGVQHPLASSVVSKAYDGGPRRAALGTYNFAGDLGKVAVPPLIAALAVAVGWRTGAVSYGLAAMAAGLAVYFVLRRLGAGGPAAPPAEPAEGPRAGGWGLRDRRGFAALSAIGVIDSAVRTPFLTFVPFLLIAKGAQVETVGFALALIFAGGAAGKLICGLAAERVGIIRTVVLTEVATGAGILVLVFLPLGWALALLPLVGAALNGTSSVLYGTVGDFVAAERRSRAFGLFYTLGIGAGALSPVAFGLLSDHSGIETTLLVLGCVAFLTLPLCQVLRPSLVAAGAAPE